MLIETASTPSPKDLGRAGMNRHALRERPSLRFLWWTSMIVCWLVDALSNRYSISPDGVASPDIASACMQGHWAAAVNAYWSPAYPVLLSFLFSVFHPHGLRELLVLKYFNCLVLIVALYCFEYFLQGLLEFVQRDVNNARMGSALPTWALRAAGYALFFWISLYLTPPTLVTPDALVFALILLAAGIIVRIAAGADGFLYYAALGIVLALGYLAKAAMFPLAFIFLAATLFPIENIRRAIPRVLLAVVVFSVVSAPYLFLLSKSKQRFTFGDSGRIAYAEYVNGVNLAIHWQGEPPGTGTPKHPTRKLLETPPVYEYAFPVAGTYPPWNDPSYWYDGVHPHFDFMGQLNTIRHSLDFYFELSTQLGSLVAGVLVLLLWANRPRDFLKYFWRTSFLWIPAVAGLTMYALILVEGRYVAGFLMLLWGGMFAAICIPETKSESAIVRSATLAIVLLLGVQIAWSAGHSVVRLASVHTPADLEVANELLHARVVPGDKVAFVGFAAQDYYWARLAA